MMKKSGAGLGALVAGLLLSGCSQASGPPSAAHAWQMKKVSFTDPGFSQPDASVGTMLVPPDWVVRGHADYTMDCVFGAPRLGLSAGRPDGSLGLDVYPGHVETWSDDARMVQQYRNSYSNFARSRDCKVRPVPSIAELLSTGLQQLSMTGDGAVQAIPALDAKLASNVSQINAQLARNPAEGTLSASSGRIHFHGTREGHPVEGWVYLSITTRAIPLSQGTGKVYLTDRPLVCVLYGAPGQLDSNLKMLTAILGTVQPDPRWQQAMVQFAQAQKQTMDNAYARVAQIHNEMAQDNYRTQQKIAAIHQDTANYASRVYANVASNRQAAMDRSAQQFSLYAGDQAVFVNPQTGQRVQMSSGYSHAWASSSSGSTDSYVLTDSPSYDPNGKIGNGGWTELQEEK